ncbi:MAG: response regulator [Phycisphaerae bacterium]|nr:response regulator [Phycisphaerae bacterium]
MESKTILFVDDEERILHSIQRITFKKPFNSLFAGSGPEALKILETRDDVAVLVTDMRMPEMTGLDLLRVCKEKYPDIVRIVLSGYSHITTLLTAINQGEIYRYILKPWESEEELLGSLRDALAHHDELKNRNVPEPVSSEGEE